ncbi:LysR family transcriptional regulator [Ruegeria jejuensis]|uniref:LysR family transcriptional regulator n=1 Tax=Ruegeria jejuensis TaxID=3233338 RepID=UPI00355C04D4
MLENTLLLQRFVSVVENGTLRRAADTLNVTQPALTRSLKLLEEAVGGALFERRGRGLSLTPLGDQLLSQARHLLREHQLAEAELAALREGERGQIRIGAASVWMTKLLPPSIAQMHETYPLFSISLQSMNYPEAVEALQSGQLDAFFGGFQHVEPLPSYLIRTPLFKARLKVVARKDHPILQQSPVRAEDLSRYHWVSFQSELAYLSTIGEAIRAATGSRPYASINCDSMMTALDLLRHGDYLALLPSSFLKSDGRGDLGIIETDLDEIAFDSGPIYRRSLQQNKAFGTLLDKAMQQVDALKMER